MEKEFLRNITQEAVNGLNNKFDDIIIQGLKLKGFEFNNKKEIAEFVKTRCRCEDRSDLKERVFYVDNNPFLFHDYNVSDIKKDFTKDEITFSIDGGKYVFI